MSDIIITPAERATLEKVRDGRIWQPDGSSYALVNAGFLAVVDGVLILTIAGHRATSVMPVVPPTLDDFDNACNDSGARDHTVDPVERDPALTMAGLAYAAISASPMPILATVLFAPAWLVLVAVAAFQMAGGV